MILAAKSGFGTELKRIREKAGKSQYELAKDSGVTAQAISLIEKGIREPNWITILKLARALGVPVGDFDTGVDPRKAEGDDEPEAESPVEPEPAQKPKRRKRLPPS